ncbi:PREDICTED: E3 ubiquitin-protein ligase RNF31, partial [Acanthisitta chloris]|uniref:E3 ubiquitin-protein ligase RNF31 n=1 Tax=Acanthisitta chloris TaxID=57068 RepID=UPI0004F0EAB0
DVGGPPRGLGALRTALSILEKYGRNLLHPKPPKHWRGVSYGNPVFRSTLGGIKGGVGVLQLLGYSEQTGEGLRFPPSSEGPHGPHVASVTADVMVLRAELDLLNQHPNPQFFTEILVGAEESLGADAIPIATTDLRAGTPEDSPNPGLGKGWACASCTFLNDPPRVLCAVCERPRLAGRPNCSLQVSLGEPQLVQGGTQEGTGGTQEGTGGPPGFPHVCPSCPQVSLSRPQFPAGVSQLRPVAAWCIQVWPCPHCTYLNLSPAPTCALCQRPLVATPPPAPDHAPSGPDHAPSQHALRQRHLREEGRRLVAIVRLAALSSLGFTGRPEAAQALQHNGGDLWGALRDLQRHRLRPFQQRLWLPQLPATGGALVRRILATLSVASWGRALLVASLGHELGLGRVDPSSEGLLGELVEAVRDCADRGALRRRLRCECAVCGWALPRAQMQWLPGCSCPLCPECFRLHFTVGVRERGVWALGCPSCAHPDLRDEAQRLCYWSTLEPQLRRCLDPETFGLVTQKLAELELLRDPHFLWCPQCSFGFIFEGDRGPAQCPQCHQCCCPQCQRPVSHWDGWGEDWENWEGTGTGRALERSSDPQTGSLEGFLREHGIECPRCGVWFALARGGCLHFQCSQCQHQFCAGCGEEFHPPGTCPSPECPLKASLHGHHPRNCLFYLRDWEPSRLQELLKASNIPFDTEPPPEAPPNPSGRGVREQKEVGATLQDQPCGKDTEPGQAGLCR